MPNEKLTTVQGERKGQSLGELLEGLSDEELVQVGQALDEEAVEVRPGRVLRRQVKGPLRRLRRALARLDSLATQEVCDAAREAKLAS